MNSNGPALPVCAKSGSLKNRAIALEPLFIVRVSGHV